MRSTSLSSTPPPLHDSLGYFPTCLHLMPFSPRHMVTFSGSRLIIKINVHPSNYAYNFALPENRTLRRIKLKIYMFKVLSSDHSLGHEAGTETEVSVSLKIAVLKNTFTSCNLTLISKFNQYLAEIWAKNGKKQRDKVILSIQVTIARQYMIKWGFTTFGISAKY